MGVFLVSAAVGENLSSLIFGMIISAPCGKHFLKLLGCSLVYGRAFDQQPT